MKTNILHSNSIITKFICLLLFALAPTLRICAYTIYLADCSEIGSYTSDKGTSGAETIESSHYITYSGISEGTIVTLTVTPEEGYQFDGWIDDYYEEPIIMPDDYNYSISSYSINNNQISFEMPGCDVWIYVCPISTAETCSESPTVTAGSKSSVTSTTATVSCSGGISDLGDCSITSYGFVMNTSGTPTISDTKHVVGTTYTSTNVSFSKNLSDLTPNTTYYVRPYATNGNGTNYGTQTSFTTLQHYAITYKKNDGSATADEIEYKDHGVSYTVSSDKFSRSGYTLVRWDTNNDGSGTSYSKGATYTGNAALTLYAVWGGTISFYANGGSGSMSSQVKTNGETYELPSNSFTAPSGKFFKCWAQGSSSGTERAVGYEHTVAGDVTFYAKWRDPNYTDYVFSCSELSVEAKPATAGKPFFITSSASQTVRSQDSILIVGSGLTPNQELEFPGLNSKFSVKSRKNGALSVKSDGTIDTVAYIFYTPGSGDTDDDLDKLTGITIKVDGTKPKQVTLTQNIIGRHLPSSGYVIAGKKDNKWYAMPSNMSSTSTPDPVEIAVDDADNPTIAYTESSNIYGLTGPTGNNITGGNGQYVRLTMSIEDGSGSAGPAPLFGSASTAPIGKSGTSKATSDLSAGWWWLLTQTNTSITNAEDAKYTIKCANNSSTLSIKNTPFQWGLYASGVEELRLIPASTTPMAEADVVAWGQKKLIIEVDKPGIGATQVRAKLNGSWSSNKSLASSTGTSVKGTNTRYNYTLDFTDEFDFSEAANNGKILLFEWLDGSDNVLYVSSVAVPKIIASSTTMSGIDVSGGSGNKGYWSDLEVHVLPGATLTANTPSFSNAVTIRELQIYPGATVVITSGSTAGTLTVASLILRNGWNRLTGDKSYDVARLYITPYVDDGHKASSLSIKEGEEAGVAYADWYIDYDQYYPIAVPWQVTVANMSYLNTEGSAEDGVKLRYYDGASRAANVQAGVGSGSNWKEYGATGNTAMPTYLVPGQGYAMTARRPAGKAFSIVRMPLTIPSDSWTTGGEQGEVSDTHKDQVSVTAHGDGSTPSYAKGWNFIANPYMSLYEGGVTFAAGDAAEYANIPDINFNEFDQLPLDATKLKPSSGFLIQAPTTTTITFSNSNITASAPSYRRDIKQTASKQKAYIRLEGEGSEDMMGILVSEQYSDDYEINADLQKLLGDGNRLRTYMQFDNMNMAYLAINETSAKEWIPVNVRIPADGEYTYTMHRASTIDELEGIYLMDYSTGKETNLIEEDYTFTAEAGTIENRFAINAVKGERQTPTDIDIVNGGGNIDSDQPVKFVYRDKIYIYHRGVIYDTTGKKVMERRAAQ